MDKRRGNPNFKPRWKRPTRSARFPSEFIADLEELARLADEGAIDLGELRKQSDRLVRVQRVIERWGAESQDKLPKYDRSWGKALRLLADLKAALEL